MLASVGYAIAAGLVLAGAAFAGICGLFALFEAWAALDDRQTLRRSGGR